MSKEDILSIFNRARRRVPYNEKLELEYEIGFALYCISRGVDRTLLDKLSDDPVFEGWMKAWMSNSSQRMGLDLEYNKESDLPIFQVLVEERRMLLEILTKAE